ncbi:MAG: 4-hydroxy-tetrahydrodipicolinate synthase [Clostridia bacterium]|nr:4-hydroxy-tetrahydrodipicolinate synthase [Clostridia bacterium]
MKNILFEGCATALVTPFCDGGIDYSSFAALIERQIAGGVEALVFCGTTGESPTVTDEEWESICRFAVKKVGGRAKVIVGCGSNSTACAAKRAEAATGYGADGLLVVTPYYNKASEDGLVVHYETVCKATELPVILYNVPSRTGCDLNVPVCERLSEIGNVVGIKEASGSVSRAACIISRLGGDLPLYSGCDELNLPLLSIGGAGFISVLSNVFPSECVRLFELVRSGKVGEASALSSLFYPFVSALFCEVNPIPVKTVLSHMGLCEERFRLPLSPISASSRKRVIDAYEETVKRIAEN